MGSMERALMSPLGSVNNKIIDLTREEQEFYSHFILGDLLRLEKTMIGGSCHSQR